MCAWREANELLLYGIEGLRGVRSPLGPQRRLWGVLPWMCALAFGVPSTAGQSSQSAFETKQRNGDCGWGCTMKVGTVTGQKFGTGLTLMRKAAKRVEPRAMEVREATTGRVVGTLPQVWAVGVVQTTAVAREIQRPAPVASPEEQLAFYRKYTTGLLRRYAHMSMESGRVPSLLGKEMFRGRVTSYRVKGFDDVVIFCCDMEKCMKKLDTTDLQLIKRIALQEYTQGETALMLGMSLRNCVLRYGQALDRLTKILLEARLLEPLKGCQGV